ncbi:hypothetical protein [Fructobacillus cardui]|nr:hypothetical protein [uncultured Fructobacillus sp.]CAK1223566.1 unnamed protein product [Fructobacillus cardui]
MFESQQLDKLRTAEYFLHDLEAVMRTYPEIGNDTNISWTWKRISDVST